MPIYTAQYLTNAEYAQLEIEAANPDAALEEARRIYEAEGDDLMWDKYDETQPLEKITIRDEDSDCLAKYIDPDCRIHLAAHALLDALETLIDRPDAESIFRHPDLLQAKAAIAKARGEG